MNAKLLAGLLVTALPAQALQAADCGMKPSFKQADNKGSSSIAVWQDNARSALLFADRMNVNTDGTRRSYSVDDFWGTTKALNNLCNAMSDGCATLTTEPQLRARRELTQEAKAKGWPADLLAKTKISSSIIPFKNGKPCPEVNGYLVSATSLHKTGAFDSCEIDNYVDALATSAIVLPKQGKNAPPTQFDVRGADVGDLVAVLSGNQQLVRFAVVGDKGPPNELGEISIALAGKLLGKQSPPTNYREIRGKPPYAGMGWTVGKTYMLVFPKSRKSSDPYLAQDRIDADGAALLEAWGGVERLKACAAVYKAN